MRILLMPNLDKPNAASCTAAAACRLADWGAQLEMDARYGMQLPLPNVAMVPFSQALQECSCIIAVGGDGTILHAASYAVAADKPLLGINVGRLGFMAGLEAGELTLLDRLMEGDYHTEERMLLECRHHSGKEVRAHLVLNDMVFSKGPVSRMVDLDIWCGGRKMTSYRADGVIVSTPTGSTAYALSAGGPIVDPAVNCLCLTPICPHSLFNRAVVLGENQTIEIHPAALNMNPIYLTADGEEAGQLVEGDRVDVRKSGKSLRLINLKNRSFYETLSQKFALHTGTDMPGE